MSANDPEANVLEREHLVRYSDLRPCRNAFVDTRTPGSEQKENFTIIGPGVSENPDQYVHISRPHGFNIGGARQPPRCVNSQHSHLTAEVFIVHSGQWAFRSGERARDGEVILGPGDVVSLPPNMFRGFENVGDGMGFLFAVLGGDDPGRVLWAPDVFDAAEKHGLILLENGRLIDTTLGQTAPLGTMRMPRTTKAQVAALDTYTSAALAQCVFRLGGAAAGSPSSVLAASGPGLREFPVLGASNESEGLEAGVIKGTHGFVLRQVTFSPGASVPAHTRAEEEVLIVHRGAVRVGVREESIELHQGDVLTVPVGSPRTFSNERSADAIVHVVRCGERPSPPVFLT